MATSVLKMLCMNCEFGGERKEGEAHKGALSTQKSCLIHNIHLADSTNLSNVIFASINPKFFFLLAREKDTRTLMTFSRFDGK